jgi:hypothetical protein
VVGLSNCLSRRDVNLAGSYPGGLSLPRFGGRQVVRRCDGRVEI